MVLRSRLSSQPLELLRGVNGPTWKANSFLTQVCTTITHSTPIGNRPQPYLKVEKCKSL